MSCYSSQVSGNTNLPASIDVAVAVNLSVLVHVGLVDLANPSCSGLLHSVNRLDSLERGARDQTHSLVLCTQDTSTTHNGSLAIEESLQQSVANSDS